MAIVPFHIVDAFASLPFTGNPAAIIPNATGLHDSEMLAITDELSMEAGFILPPTTAGADIRLRYFTRRREAALSGHVTIAAFASMLDRGFYRIPPVGLDLRLETGAGLLPVRLETRPDGRPDIQLGLPAPRFGEQIPAGEVAVALGVPAECLLMGGQGPQRVSCGFDQIVVPVCDREVMRGDFGRPRDIARLADLRGVGGLTLTCSATRNEEADFHLRFFHPGMGVAEDIASGTSMAAAAAYLVHHGLTPPGDRITLVTEQGHALGRPTLARQEVETRDRGRVTAVTVAGTGVVVMRGSFHFLRKVMKGQG